MTEWAIAVNDFPHSWKVIADTSTEAVIKFMTVFDKHISDGGIRKLEIRMVLATPALSEAEEQRRVEC